MNEPLKRRNLLAVTSAPEALPEEAIAAVAARNGFPNVVQPVSAAPAAAQQGAVRRQRAPTGRDHQFNVRLRLDTLDFIYAQANDRNIPVAQVIEEMAEALKRQKQS
jgi:hypothetical protein